MALQVEVVSPEQVLYSGECTQVLARTLDGEIGFLTGHAPFLGALGIGVVRLTTMSGDQVSIAVHGGFVEVSNNLVTLLSDVAESGAGIDVERAREAASRATSVLAADSDSDEALDALRRAETRLRAAGAEEA
ncbi:MAG: ATP synthase F1 subunit epsilon [Acidimicrobiales bacterium]